MSLEAKKRIYERMFLIRNVEEGIASRYSKGKMRCPTHLSIGQEAVPSVLGEFLRNDDYAISTHRGHAHYLAKGGDMQKMIAEIYGKETGCSKGRGGSMHLIDLGVNFMGTSAIVGNSIPIGVGLALSAQLRNSNQVSIIYLGDAAVEEGVFYESINFAALRKLPAIFICENNFFSVYTKLNDRQPEGRKISQFVKSLGLQTFSGDGYEIEESYQCLGEATSYVRKTGMAAFVEMKTYRWREHCGPNFDDILEYRNSEDSAKWLSRDPLPILKNKILSVGNKQLCNIERIEQEILSKIKQAFDFAEDSSYPNSNYIKSGIFSKDLSKLYLCKLENNKTYEQKINKKKSCHEID